MKQSKLLQKTIIKLVDTSFNDGRILESKVAKSIKVLKSLPTIDAIWALSEYIRELKRRERQFTMYIETVVPLSAVQLKKVRKIVEKKNKITKIKVLINPEIIGGFKLRIGDNLWDESVLSKINQVKEEIINGRSNQSN